ncbi:MAG: hypothetical protein P3B98_06870 [Gemmatimonadota bacterium]|nr:hypothetical protein [Gemmatimonadota bacterium]
MTRPMVSEYYARGRAIFADAGSFAFFVLGFLGAGPFAWPALRAAFEAGAYDRGLAVFIARLFGSGLALGLIGYVTGALAGRVWQGVHQGLRARRDRAVPRTTSNESAGLAATSSALTSTEAIAQLDAPLGESRAEPRDAMQRQVPGAMSCREGPLSDAQVALLARRAATAVNDRRYVEAIATDVVTIAAWDGLDIAGVARLLSSGYGTFIVTDLLVDPYYEPAAVERALMRFAEQRVPKGGRLVRV